MKKITGTKAQRKKVKSMQVRSSVRAGGGGEDAYFVRVDRSTMVAAR